MIFKDRLTKLASGVKNVILSPRYSSFSNITRTSSPDSLPKYFTYMLIPCQGKFNDSDIGKCIRYNITFNKTYNHANKLSCNDWINLKKSDFHTSSFCRSYDKRDNHRREKREANILIGLMVALIIIVFFVYSKIDLKGYDKPSEGKYL